MLLVASLAESPASEKPEWMQDIVFQIKWEQDRFPEPECVAQFWRVYLVNSFKKLGYFRAWPPNLVSWNVWFFSLWFWSYIDKVRVSASPHSQYFSLAERICCCKNRMFAIWQYWLKYLDSFFIMWACLRYSQGKWKESFHWKDSQGFIWNHWVTEAQAGRNHVVSSTCFLAGPPTPFHKLGFIMSLKSSWGGSSGGFKQLWKTLKYCT